MVPPRPSTIIFAVCRRKMPAIASPLKPAQRDSNEKPESVNPASSLRRPFTSTATEKIASIAAKTKSVVIEAEKALSDSLYLGICGVANLIPPCLFFIDLGAS